MGSIEYPELIGKRKFEFDFAIGDKVKHKECGFEFIVADIDVKFDTGITYMGLGELEGEKELLHGQEENLELVERDYIKKED